MRIPMKKKRKKISWKKQKKTKANTKNEINLTNLAFRRINESKNVHKFAFI
jgi:hypothetical protein